MEPCIASCVCILYDQRDATYTMFFIINAIHVSGGFSTHHQELIKLYVLYCLAFLLSTADVDGLELVFRPIYTSGRQQESKTIKYIKFYKLLMLGGKTARNM